MANEQKARALALARIPAVMSSGVRMAYIYSHGSTHPVPNLADETGAVEGALHRVLEKLVGEPVEVQVMKGGTWVARAASAHACLDGANWTALHPTRLDAIVAALLALEPGR